MIFMLVPRGGAEWEDIRLFTSYSAVEQVMKSKKEDWCFTIAFDGVDELEPKYVYTLQNGIVDRKVIQ